MSKLMKVMARKSIRLTTDDQLRNGNAPVPGSYAVPGKNSAVFYTTKERAEKLADSGAVLQLEGGKPKAAATPPSDDPPPSDHLPDDFPYRKQLHAAGLKTRTLVREHPDLTEVSGIGQAYADRILAALDALEGEG